MRAIALIVLLCTPLLLPACSDARIVAGGDDGGTSATGGDTGGCPDLSNEGPGAPVTLRVSNRSDRPLFMPPLVGCTDHRVQVTPQDVLPGGYWPAESCDATCTEVLAGGCACPLGCGAPSLLRVEPGGELRVEWPGVLLVPDEIPPTCEVAGGCSPGPCPVQRTAVAGTYEARAAYVIEPPACAPGSGNPASCECDPGAEGWCLTQAFHEGPPDDVVSATFTYPAPGGVTLDFVLLP